MKTIKTIIIVVLLYSLITKGVFGFIPEMLNILSQIFLLMIQLLMGMLHLLITMVGRL